MTDPEVKPTDTPPVDWQTRYRDLEMVTNTLRAELDETKQTLERERAAYRDRLIRAEVRLAAQERFHDPDDAVRFLDLDALDVDITDDGEVDRAQITAALDDLLVAKPYLSRKHYRFTGTADGGARETSRPRQIEDRWTLRHMTPTQILQAKAQGQLEDLLSGKTDYQYPER